MQECRWLHNALYVEFVVPKIQSIKTNHLKFPSGRTVKSCRNDVKKLKKELALVGRKISTSQALDIIAEKNGLPGGWHKAILQLSSNDKANSYPRTEIYSRNENLYSFSIEGVCPSHLDEKTQELILEHKPSQFNHQLKSRFPIDMVTTSVALNEKGEAYRVTRIKGVEDSHSFHHSMYALGYYQLVEDFIPKKYSQYDTVLAPDRTLHFQFPGWNSRPFDLFASLQMKMVLWLDYMDSEPPIDNNDNFSQLRKNRPHWTFDMCTLYWKYSKEITGREFSESPSPEIQKMVQYATLAAVKGYHSLIEERDKLAETY